MFKKQYKVIEYITHFDGSSTTNALYIGFDQRTASERLKDAVKTAIRAIELDDKIGMNEGFEVTEFWVREKDFAVQTGARIELNDGSNTQIVIEANWVEAPQVKTGNSDRESGGDRDRRDKRGRKGGGDS